MSAGTDGVVHYDCTRIALVDALAALPTAGYLMLEVRAKWADVILAQLPEASPLVTEDQAREIMQQQVEAQKPRLLAEVAAATDERLQESMQRVVAAERERIAELATRKRAVYCKPCDGAPCSYDDELAPFADVIREQP